MDFGSVEAANPLGNFDELCLKNNNKLLKVFEPDTSKSVQEEKKKLAIWKEQ